MVNYALESDLNPRWHLSKELKFRAIAGDSFSCCHQTLLVGLMAKDGAHPIYLTFF